MKERGEGNLQYVIALTVTVLVIFVCWKMVPVHVAAYSFRDAVRSQVKFSHVETRPFDQIQSELYKKAVELNLPIERKQIKVGKAKGLFGVNISVEYAVPIDFIVYKHVSIWNLNETPDTVF